MPTGDQRDELINNCYWVWTTIYNGKEVNGYIVYKVKDNAHKGKRAYVNIDTYGYNVNTDAHIFLPAAGYYSGAGLYQAGSSGDYWTRSLSEYSDLARFLFFTSNGVNTMKNYVRQFGQSVRPVQRK